MENASSVWLLTLIALVAGAMIGALAYRLLSPSVKQAKKTEAELDRTREELTSYRASVGRHFDKTSKLVNDLTQDYVRVYQHLAKGAQELGDNKSFVNMLEKHQDKFPIPADEAGDADDSSSPEPPAIDGIDTAAEKLSDSLEGNPEGVEAVPDTESMAAPAEKTGGRIVH